MKKVVVFAACMVMLASLAMASNTGFKLNYTLHYVLNYSNTNWVSLPYFYYPDGNINNTTERTTSICTDINTTAGTPVVANIQKFDVVNDAPVTNFCSTVTSQNFPIVAGESYAVVPNRDNVRFDIVGSHDDDFDNAGDPTHAITLHYVTNYSNTNWVSVPYHTTLARTTDICNEINTQAGGPVVANIQKFDVVNDAPVTNFCSTVTSQNFPIVAGEGYAVVPQPAGDGKTWHPSHY